MFILKNKYIRLKSLFKRYKLRKIYQVKDLKLKNQALKEVLNENKENLEHIKKQKQECMKKVAELKDINEKIKENYQKLSNQKMELQKELKEVKEKYEDLRKETFGYNFFSKVASKQMLREIMGKDKE